MLVVSRFLAKPQQPHLNVAKQILGYLKGTVNYGIL
jgi:hypothetical protein